MMLFSERLQVVPDRILQINSIDDRLRNRLYNFFVSKVSVSHKIEIEEYISDRLGIVTYNNRYCRQELHELFLSNNEDRWYIPYDIIELLFTYLKNDFYNSDYSEIDDCIEDYKNTIFLLENELNTILSEEKSGYRIQNSKFIKITSKDELEAIKIASSSSFEAVNVHIAKAASLYSDRNNPDYENSIKESISAVESICCIITESTSSAATLGAMLKKLEDSGVTIHGALKSAFSQIYGYTSDANGIRHGSIDFSNAPEEDARYMLISCSAFINYLISKYTKSTEIR